ncbi:hypothetical protein ACR82Z_02260 [Mycoplasma sp. 6243]|uniref:hypothetical protein n=1 Tax=Mycoplasma sp. 6243 TaxID=3440865 RepID=UPI003EC15290
MNVFEIFAQKRIPSWIKDHNYKTIEELNQNIGELMNYLNITRKSVIQNPQSNFFRQPHKEYLENYFDLEIKRKINAAAVTYNNVNYAPYENDKRIKINSSTDIKFVIGTDEKLYFRTKNKRYEAKPISTKDMTHYEKIASRKTLAIRGKKKYKSYQDFFRVVSPLIKLLDLKIRKIASSDKYTNWWNKNIATNTRWTRKMLVKNSITSQIYKIKQTKFMNILPQAVLGFSFTGKSFKTYTYKCFLRVSHFLPPLTPPTNAKIVWEFSFWKKETKNFISVADTQIFYLLQAHFFRFCFLYFYIKVFYYKK